MKYLFYICLFSTIGLHAQSDSTTMESILRQAFDYYPIMANKPLVAAATQKSVQNIKSTFYPQLAFSAQATYQSEVTDLPIDLPNIGFETLSKDQYKIQGILSQAIYDGGISRTQADMAQLQGSIENIQTDMEWEHIQEKIIQLYFTVLQLRSQREQRMVSQNDLEATRERIGAGVNAGTILESELLKLDAEKIKLDQIIVQLDHQIKYIIKHLGLLSNQSFDAQTHFVVPEQNVQTTYAIANRPQLAWFKQKKEHLGLGEILHQKQSQPMASAFIQGGYGKPGLNFLKNSFEPYFIGGFQLRWNLHNLYSSKNDREILRLNQQKIDVQEKSYRIQIESQLENQYEEMTGLAKLLSQDDQVLQLRREVKEVTNAQLENGVITVSDYLKEFHAEEIARIAREIHHIQWVRSQYLIKHITGNFTDYDK